jgi:hypothetical protein
MQIKVATVPVWVWVGFGSEFRKTFGYGLVLVLRQSFSLVLLCSDRTRKPFFKNFATFFQISLKMGKFSVKTVLIKQKSEFLNI